ncbi:MULTISPECIES: hypothetical protein [Bacillaceae]|uniref:hypothetical protein n=1 Tax=Bacillaceae TaxID=186817 RepID=UPI000A2AB5D7|nr:MULTISPECIES: hypothetical protein [unclassified Bacillus (in: firmicutes)]PGY13070.1 hypothetical protein COE25_07795 [Bacillus sp. AFS031507]SMQ73789.1 hypothetical protein SAMN05444673_2385 [Bacillus sp. OV166]
MNFEMQKANMLAENINGFIKYVQKSHENKNSFRFNPDKLFQIKLLIEEFKFQILADELLRINKFSWDEKYTYYLVDQFIEGIEIIDEYIHNNYNDLFLLTARIYTLKDLSQSFSRQGKLYHWS